ncbi:hexitol phosphatase HxpB [Filimonas effusa]|uniref:Hexitol phosphatase HxpB n=1 Tax=Filimonas effusa TaxID=2508721 RepID=A0A4Q1DBX3_9BACT|nr:hexitol phosphatase HxpB [Filimonas effusa]RXK86947.1 hexitol phosphatase HxpB [Filimonas effusa]
MGKRLLDTVIFDMDGLLIDSEPLWAEAADELFSKYGFKLSHEQYATTTGLRTREFVQWWFRFHNIPESEDPKGEQEIIQLVSDKVAAKGKIMPGVGYIFDFFAQHEFKIGLASSSPQGLIELVVDICGIRNFLNATASAGQLAYGKPHPQVYLDCAAKLDVAPTSCIAFEDSFNGMIAAKAARMKCVVVPHHSQLKEERWGAADLKLSSLQNFGQLHLDIIG